MGRRVSHDGQSRGLGAGAGGSWHCDQRRTGIGNGLAYPQNVVQQFAGVSLHDGNALGRIDDPAATDSNIEVHIVLSRDFGTSLHLLGGRIGRHVVIVNHGKTSLTNGGQNFISDAGLLDAGVVHSHHTLCAQALQQSRDVFGDAGAINNPVGIISIKSDHNLPPKEIFLISAASDDSDCCGQQIGYSFSLSVASFRRGRSSFGIRTPQTAPSVHRTKARIKAVV